jgi:predicted MPP superfamily phosphohydrolase
VVETHGLQLVGLDYMNADEDTFELHPSDDSRTIKSVLGSLHLKDGMPSVLLHHSPAGAQHAAANGIDLMIAGHTHGGQFFPGTLVATAVFPFTHGLYHRGPLQVFVSPNGKVITGASSGRGRCSGRSQLRGDGGIAPRGPAS